MNQITIYVEKARLLSALKENREKHGAAYEKAKAGYLKLAQRRLNEWLERLMNGELLDRAFLEAPPDDHTGDYDDVIQMMEWSQNDSIELTQGQFKQYVMDDWGWKDQWVTSNTAYLEAGA